MAKIEDFVQIRSLSSQDFKISIVVGHTSCQVGPFFDDEASAEWYKERVVKALQEMYVRLLTNK